MVSGEAPHTNFIVFGLTRPGLEPTIYRTRGEQDNHGTIDAVSKVLAHFVNLCYVVNVESFGIGVFQLEEEFTTVTYN